MEAGCRVIHMTGKPRPLHLAGHAVWHSPECQLVSYSGCVLTSVTAYGPKPLEAIVASLAAPYARKLLSVVLGEIVGMMPPSFVFPGALCVPTSSLPSKKGEPSRVLPTPSPSHFDG
jgi:hypothetical protein